MSFLDSIGNGFGQLGMRLFTPDQSLAGQVDPTQAAALQNHAALGLGLGLLAASHSRDPWGTAFDAFNSAQSNYQGAMQNAFRNTLAKREADFQQQERALQLKQQQRSESEQASQTAQRVLTGLNNAPDQQAYLSLVQNTPEFKVALNSLGIQPPYIGPMADPGGLDQFKSQLTAAASVGAPAQQPIKLSQGDVLLDPVTKQPIASAAPKSTVEYKDAGDKLIPVNNVTGQVVQGLPPIPKTKTPDQEAGSFTPDMRALLGGLAQAGISLPAGLRSQKQQVATLQGLLDANPGAAPGDIVDKIRTGQLDFNGAKRSTAQLSTLAAAADVQSRKIEKDLGSLGPIVQKLPNGPAKLVDIMTKLQNNWSWNGDANTTEAVGFIKELAGEYAKMVSGSTGAAAPPEGEMKSALGLMQSALTKNGYLGMHDFLLTTSQNRRDSVREGLHAAATSGASVGAAPTAAPQTPTKAPPQAVNYLLAHPEARAQFKAKYGYLPGGF